MKSPLAYLSLIATVTFLIAVSVLLFLAPDINPIRSGISFYALTRYGFIVGIALALVGLSGIVLAIALWRTILSVARRIGLILLVAWGITSILAGAFPSPGLSFRWPVRQISGYRRNRATSSPIPWSLKSQKAPNTGSSKITRIRVQSGDLDERPKYSELPAGFS